MPEKPILIMEGLCKSFGGTEIIRGVSLQVLPREVLVIVGPSGTGKSTLLQCINLLTRPSSGRIWLGDQEITAPGVNVNQIRRRIGMVFQDFNLFNHLKTLDNITIGLTRVLGMKADAARRKGLFELERVGMVDHADKYPAQLSGGQKQRVAIARALGMDPAIMLFDEPTSALDPELTGEVLSVMQKLAREGMTMIVVSHEMGFAREVAQRIVFMEDGCIVEEGTPQSFFEAPRTERARKFFSKISGARDGADDPVNQGRDECRRRP
ncbi:amino acid ABC transporter ATP-binding protein [Desulfosarcina sp.]|uniref:amino acid ABC transporter ATP-binding protein n=1 Tax=Desulfosarcina sp. TaxID=2027861 RepID=UPI003970BCC9